MPNVLPLIRTKREKFAVKVLNSHKFSQKVYRFGDLWEDCGCKTGAVAKKCDSNLHHKSCKNGNPKPFLSRFVSEKVPGFVHSLGSYFAAAPMGWEDRGDARVRAQGAADFFWGGEADAPQGGAAKPRRAPSGAARREAVSPCGAGGVQGLCSSPARLQKRGDAAGKGLLGKNEALCDIAGKRQGVWGAIEGAAERLDPRIAAVGH